MVDVPYVVSQTYSSLSFNDAKSFVLHQIVKDKLESDCETVVAQALSNINRWIPQNRNDGKTAEYLRAWKSLLTAKSLAPLYGVLDSTEETACDLRQCSPFAGVMNNEERLQALDKFRREWEKMK